jgi:hypothetical protein
MSDQPKRFNIHLRSKPEGRGPDASFELSDLPSCRTLKFFDEWGDAVCVFFQDEGTWERLRLVVEEAPEWSAEMMGER